TPDDNESNAEDSDVPFHLPKSDELEEEEANQREVKPKNIWDSANPVYARNMPTMPIPREPGVPDPKQTLPGSGGLDPNPDFADSENTAQHQVVSPANPIPPPPAQTAPINQSRYQQPAPYIPPPPQRAQPGQQYARPVAPQPPAAARKLPGRKARR